MDHFKLYEGNNPVESWLKSIRGIRAKGVRVQGIEATGGSARGRDEGLRGKWPLHPTSDHRGPPAVRGNHSNPPPGAGPRAHGRLPPP